MNAALYKTACMANETTEWKSTPTSHTDWIHKDHFYVEKIQMQITFSNIMSKDESERGKIHYVCCRGDVGLEDVVALLQATFPLITMHSEWSIYVLWGDVRVACLENEENW